MCQRPHRRSVAQLQLTGTTHRYSSQALGQAVEARVHFQRAVAFGLGALGPPCDSDVKT